ncbi:hypothetical protein AGLY_012837 [Aphis glycines]|uniref:Uncharacterized protein n=1 Tax=Aphis glycines TaxID=307491 RepID=A0A6G0T8K4_APHGL|nr:hypothetical protein AGLY_012837 [Aphis glycines]
MLYGRIRHILLIIYQWRFSITPNITRYENSEPTTETSVDIECFAFGSSKALLHCIVIVLNLFLSSSLDSQNVSVVRSIKFGTIAGRLVVVISVFSVMSLNADTTGQPSSATPILVASIASGQRQSAKTYRKPAVSLQLSINRLEDVDNVDQCSRSPQLHGFRQIARSQTTIRDRVNMTVETLPSTINAIDGLFKTFISDTFSLFDITPSAEQPTIVALSTQGTSACKAAEGIHTCDNPLSKRKT